MANVFSFCLYGPYNPLYYSGLLENIFLAGKYFPTWKVYVYYAPDVEESMINHLKACSSVVLIETHELGAVNMIHRFFAIDEPGVNLMMVRDADSRIHWKDRWAIREFIKSDKLVHTIRDNIVHNAKLMGGLWGMKKSAGINIHNEYDVFKNTNYTNICGEDQEFLGNIIYPKIKNILLVHYSNRRFAKDEYAVEFPFEWTNDIYCGRIESNFIDKNEPVIKKLYLPTVYTRIRDDKK
jgi:hypothetical protein